MILSVSHSSHRSTNPTSVTQRSFKPQASVSVKVCSLFDRRETAVFARRACLERILLRLGF